MQNQEIAEYALKALLEAGADKAQCSFTTSEKNELNIEAEKISLMRTTFDNIINLRAIKDGKEGRFTINKVDKESIDQAAKETLSMAESSQPDEAKDISPMQESEAFSYGENKPDLETMYKRMDDFLIESKKRYPKTILEGSVLDHVYSQSFFLNSNGVKFQEDKGQYNFMVMFTSKDGENASSFNYDSCHLNNLDKELIDCSLVDTLLRQSSEQTILKPTEGKFVGDIVLTPHTLADFLRSYVSYVEDYEMMTGTSVFKDKKGEQIAHNSLSLQSSPVSEDMVDKSFVTHDGFKNENMPIIEKGVLKNFVLSQYGAKKANLERSSSSGGSFVVDAGEEDFENLIKNIKRGVLLCRFSGGRPGSNGEFSGVAKNSYYIEDGKIQFPIQEVMVSGNLIEMFKDVKGITKERVNYGAGIIPWMSVGGITISGK